MKYVPEVANGLENFRNSFALSFPADLCECQFDIVDIFLELLQWKQSLMEPILPKFVEEKKNTLHNVVPNPNLDGKLYSTNKKYL